jgi:hypothetical protein
LPQTWRIRRGFLLRAGFIARVFAFIIEPVRKPTQLPKRAITALQEKSIVQVSRIEAKSAPLLLFHCPATKARVSTATGHSDACGTPGIPDVSAAGLHDSLRATAAA